MKALKFILTGILFGIVMTKSEAISWYRIQEMFRFQSFHMFGIIGTAVAIGIIGVYLIKKYKIKDIEGQLIVIPTKDKGWKRALIGGIIFGLGWALMLLVIFGAVLGTYIYGIVKDKLPH